jgi:hypothetical protein
MPCVLGVRERGGVLILEKGHLMYLTRLALTVIFITFLFAPGTASAFQFNLGSRFFDYGNGAINLDNVTHVGSQMAYQIVLPIDSEEEMLKEYEPSVTKNAIAQTLKFLDPKELDNTEFYYIKIKSRIFFDRFELMILGEEEFLKVPDTEEKFIQTIKKYPIFQKFVEKIGNYLEIEGDLDKKIDVLSSKVRELKKEDYLRIKEGLESTLHTYKRVVK